MTLSLYIGCKAASSYYLHLQIVRHWQYSSAVQLYYKLHLKGLQQMNDLQGTQGH